MKVFLNERKDSLEEMIERQRFLNASNSPINEYKFYNRVYMETLNVEISREYNFLIDSKLLILTIT